MVGFGWIEAIFCNFSLSLLMMSLIVGQSRSLWIMEFRTNHGAFVIVLSILFCIVCSLWIWELDALPHVVELYVSIGCM